MTEAEPPRSPEPRDAFAIRPSAQLAKLREAAAGLFARIEHEGVDLDAPAHPLTHMDTCKQLAEVSIRASVLIEQLGFDPEFLLNVKLAELPQGGTEGHGGT